MALKPLKAFSLFSLLLLCLAHSSKVSFWTPEGENLWYTLLTVLLHVQPETPLGHSSRTRHWLSKHKNTNDAPDWASMLKDQSKVMRKLPVWICKWSKCDCQGVIQTLQNSINKNRKKGNESSLAHEFFVFKLQVLQQAACRPTITSGNQGFKWD